MSKWETEAMETAKHIGEVLKQRYRASPCVDSKQGNIPPPPTFSDITLAELGKNQVIY
jgi:hypothetical protein